MMADVMKALSAYLDDKLAKYKERIMREVKEGLVNGNLDKVKVDCAVEITRSALELMSYLDCDEGDVKVTIRFRNYGSSKYYEIYVSPVHVLKGVERIDIYEDENNIYIVPGSSWSVGANGVVRIGAGVFRENIDHRLISMVDSYDAVEMDGYVENGIIVVDKNSMRPKDL